MPDIQDVPDFDTSDPGIIQDQYPAPWKPRKPMTSEDIRQVRQNILDALGLR